jgi:hypothetical protein
MTRPALTLLAALLLAGAAGLLPARAASFEQTDPFVGVRHIHRTTTVPRLLDMHLVEVDPAASGIDFFVTPSNGAAPGETVRQTTRGFLTQYNAQIAVNASFFSFVSGDNMNINGLSASRGDVYSTFEAGRVDALNISANRVATIIRSTLGSGTSHTPRTTLYNAVGGSERLVTGGVNTANAGDAALHPRTAAGVTADGKLLLMTVDGRNQGHSLGVSLLELGDLMLQFGARDAINLDGGGSTTLAMADPTPRVVNVPVGISNVPGSERLNGNNLAIFAAQPSQPAGSRYVFADFEAGDETCFRYDLTYSGSTEGALATSVAEAITSGGHNSAGCQRLAIRDDPAVAGGQENPDGWFVRHLAGAPGAASPATRAGNEIRPAEGVIGLWAKTSQAGVQISLAIDDSDGVTADRGIRQDLIADGQWHRYQWSLEDDSQWEGWVNGDGLINSADFTIDSIQLFGGNANATVFIDDVFHETSPAAVLPGDFDHSGEVNASDLSRWRDAYGSTGADATGDGLADGADFLEWQRNLGAYHVAVAAPEPRTAWLAAMATVAAMIRRPRQGSLRDELRASRSSAFA